MATQQKRRTRNQRTAEVMNPPITMDQVPVKRIAEFVPASFTAAANDDIDDALNHPDARWYKTGDDTMALVADSIGVLEFSIPALVALCERAAQMSATNLVEVLGLE